MSRYVSQPGDVTRCGPPDADPSFTLRAFSFGRASWSVFVYSDGVVDVCERSTAIYSDECVVLPGGDA